MGHHRHASSFATIVLDGGYVEVREAVPEICQPGQIVVHEAAEEHADRFASDTRCLNVELTAENGLRGGSIALDGPLRTAAQRVVRAFYARPRELTDAVKSLQLALREQAAACVRVPPRWLQRVIEEFPWVQPIPLREAAGAAGLHETHFSRAFRRHVGMPAKDYRARARLRLASQLLLTTTAPIARIALKAGFSDQSHLTRAFSERLGLSPAGYRRIFTR